MLAVAIIVFRESLEAALLIGILAAATRGLARRGAWLAMGAAAGLLGAVAVGVAADAFPALTEGAHQELFNAGVLAAAVAMLAWHNIWMARHGAELAAHARGVAAAVRTGARTLAAVALVAGLAVLREGSETVLFVLGMASGAGVRGLDLAGGGALGLVCGAGLGVALYLGLVRVPMRRLFSVTGALLALVAAGMAGQAARFLIQADLLPSLATPLWDSSAWLPMEGLAGTTLHVLMGYEAQPAGMQVLWFAAVLLAIVAGGRWARAAPLRGAVPA